MTRPPGGVTAAPRKANGSGSIKVVYLTTGEARYHARLHNKYLGSFESRRDAQKAIDDAMAKEQER